MRAGRWCEEGGRASQVAEVCVSPLRFSQMIDAIVHLKDRV